MEQCGQCGAQLSAGASLCGSCGAARGPRPAPAVEEPLICAGCGILVDGSRAACEACGGAYGAAPVRAHAQPGNGYWVAVRATFTCNACDFDVPLNHFELDEGVVCTRCGLEQRYEPSSWQDLVTFAHGVGDVGVPGPEGRFPDAAQRLLQPKPYADLGLDDSWAYEDDFQASPGNPPCRTCRAPYVVVARRDRALEVACSRCPDRRAYELPARAPGGLAGVLADEHAQGGREAALLDDNGVSVLRCPNCSAPLPGVKDADGVVTCGYCQVACRISSRTHARAGHKNTPAKTWWLYFEGPSALRGELLAAARADAAEAERRRERAAQAMRTRADRDAAAARARRAAEAAKRRGRTLSLAAVVGSTVLVGGLWYSIVYRPGVQERAAAAQAAAKRAGDDAVSGYAFALSHGETAALFGGDLGPNTTATLRDGGVFERVYFTGDAFRRGRGYGLGLAPGPRYDLETALARLARLVPNRLRDDPPRRELASNQRGVLRVGPAGIQISLHATGALDLELAEAMLAAVKHATLDGPVPTAAQLRSLNGPSLGDVARFDAAVPIEGASAAFARAFPDGKCGTIDDLLAKRTELVCTIDVDDPRIREVRLAWPSTAKAHLGSAALAWWTQTSKTSAYPIGCLEQALGPGEQKVTDFASGSGQLVWKLGARGDTLTLDGGSLTFGARDGVAPGEIPDWVAHYAKVVDAVAACGA